MRLFLLSHDSKNNPMKSHRVLFDFGSSIYNEMDNEISPFYQSSVIIYKTPADYTRIIQNLNSIFTVAAITSRD